jgi:hypothetical protein
MVMTAQTSLTIVNCECESFEQTINFEPLPWFSQMGHGSLSLVRKTAQCEYKFPHAVVDLSISDHLL